MAYPRPFPTALLCVVLLFGAAGFFPASAEQAVLAGRLQQTLGTAGERPAPVVGGEGIRAWVALRRFYAERAYRPAWSGPEAAPLLEQLAVAVDQVAAHGLDPTDYHAAALGRSSSERDALATELLATDTYLTLAAHLIGGRLDPVSIEPDWTASRRERDLVRHLERALAERRIEASLAELAPRDPGYAVLKEALAMYRQAAREGGWQPIEAGPALKLGNTGPRVAALRERLRATGLLAAGGEPLQRFDTELESAVAAFQRRIGIEADGVVGAVTLRELNKRPADRIDQIRVNMERWRWLPEDLGERHVRVNIADFRLETREQGKIVRGYDVIVGRTYRQTPVFSDRIAYLVLNPWWETPPSLARQDKLPAFKKDPASVERLGFEVLDRRGGLVDPGSIRWAEYSVGDFPFRLRQRPGPLNALGQVKLMFPNKHNVYLHDTPSRELFSRTERAFSSGCVRVSDALGLSEWVLAQTSGWSRAKIDAELATGRETRVNLAVKVPVHILYLTAVSEPDGGLRLINDIYARDARLVAALGLAAPAPGGRMK